MKFAYYSQHGTTLKHGKGRNVATNLVRRETRCPSQLEGGIVMHKVLDKHTDRRHTGLTHMIPVDHSARRNELWSSWVKSELLKGSHERND